MKHESQIMSAKQRARPSVSSFMFRDSCHGMTTIEMAVYSGLLAIISVFLIQTILTLTVIYRKVEAERDIVSAERIIMEMLARELQGASAAYSATSATTTQLSIETPLNAVSPEETTFVDVYLDNGRLYVKREGAEAFALSPESVRVAQFKTERIAVGSRESMRVTLSLESRGNGGLQASSTIISAFSPRGNY